MTDALQAITLELQQLDDLVYAIDIAAANGNSYTLSADDTKLILRLREILHDEDFFTEDLADENADLHRQVEDLEDEISSLEDSAREAYALRIELHKLTEAKQNMEDFYQDLLEGLNERLTSLRGSVIDAIKRPPTF